MSASPMARHLTESKSIPIRRVALHDPSELPHDYSTTPGGTLYSTTPGGTKIVYDRSFLLNLRSSPVARTPPSYDIPEALQKGTPNKSPKRKPKTNKPPPKESNGNNHYLEEEQFQFDM